jgi:hypothetical protein
MPPMSRGLIKLFRVRTPWFFSHKFSNAQSAQALSLMKEMFRGMALSLLSQFIERPSFQFANVQMSIRASSYLRTLPFPLPEIIQWTVIIMDLYSGFWQYGLHVKTMFPGFACKL